MLRGHTGSCLLSPPAELPTGLSRHRSRSAGLSPSARRGLGCWLRHRPHPAAGKRAGVGLGSSLSSSPPSEFLLTAWKANHCKLFQSQLNLERDFLTVRVTCVARRNETRSWRAEMDQNQCSAAGATCKIALRSCSIPRACDQQGDPYRTTASDPPEDNKSVGERLASSGDLTEKLIGAEQAMAPLLCPC